MKKLLYSILICLCSTSCIGSNSSTDNKQSDYEVKLKPRMQYLNDIAEVKWWEVDNNTIYIGFSPMPDDVNVICNAAAFVGNKEIQFGCHVFAVDANVYSSKSSLVNNWYYAYTTTYRHGKKEK